MSSRGGETHRLSLLLKSLALAVQIAQKLENLFGKVKSIWMSEAADDQQFNNRLKVMAPGREINRLCEAVLAGIERGSYPAPA
jgi:hypothetical protein